MEQFFALAVAKLTILSAETQQVRAIQMEVGFLALVVQSEGGVYK